VADPFTLVLPYPPTVNTYWRHARGRTYIAEEGRAYRNTVSWTIVARRRGFNPIADPVVLEIELTPPDARVRDVDNVLKALLDAMKRGGAYLDDSQIWRLCISMGAPGEGSVRVTVTPCAAPPGWRMTAAERKRQAKRDPSDKLRLDGSLRLRR
jgi:crossover junction endodeoxyribonuclease RusA